MSTWLFGRLLLDRYCLAERDGGNIHDPYAVENSDTPIGNDDAAVLRENFRGLNFRDLPRNPEIGLFYRPPCS